MFLAEAEVKAGSKLTDRLKAFENKVAEANKVVTSTPRGEGKCSQIRS